MLTSCPDCGHDRLSVRVITWADFKHGRPHSFDPWDIEDIAETVDELLENESRRTLLSEAGPPQAAQFTWDRAAKSTSDLYHRVADA